MYTGPHGRHGSRQFALSTALESVPIRLIRVLPFPRRVRAVLGRNTDVHGASRMARIAPICLINRSRIRPHPSHPCAPLPPPCSRRFGEEHGCTRGLTDGTDRANLPYQPLSNPSPSVSSVSSVCSPFPLRAHPSHPCALPSPHLQLTPTQRTHTPPRHRQRRDHKRRNLHR